MDLHFWQGLQGDHLVEGAPNIRKGAEQSNHLTRQLLGISSLLYIVEETQKRKQLCH